MLVEKFVLYIFYTVDSTMIFLGMCNDVMSKILLYFTLGPACNYIHHIQLQLAPFMAN